MNKDSISHVVPAILPKSYHELETKLALIADVVPWVQIDATDGKFVPNKTWPYTNDPSGVFSKIVRQEAGLPSWEEMSFEVDLMVTDPSFESDKWIAAGASRLVIHMKTIEMDQFEILAKNINDKGVELILGVELGVPLEDISKYAQLAHDNGGLSGIQCMGIKREGFQGEKLDESVYAELKKIHGMFPEVILSVDGGVNLEDAEALHTAGATRLICGSSIFDAVSPRDAIVDFEKILRKNI